MKVINTITLGLVTATLLFVGCSDNAKDVKPAKKELVKPTKSEETLSLRKKTLFNEEIIPHGTKYSETYTGSGHKIKH